MRSLVLSALLLGATVSQVGSAQVVEIASAAAEAYSSYQKDKDARKAHDELVSEIRKASQDIQNLIWNMKQRQIQSCADAMTIDFESFLDYQRAAQEVISSNYLNCLTEAHRVITGETASTAQAFVAPFQILNVTNMFMRSYLGYPINQLAQKGYEVANIMDRSWQAKPGILRQLEVAEDGEVWGVNPDQVVYRWNGSTWVVPQASARLVQISVGSRSNIWGIDASNNVWKWNGSGWYVPTSTARLTRISAAADGTVWGVNADNVVFKWTGSTWIQPQPSARLTEISVGSANVIWGIAPGGTVWRWDGAGFVMPNANARLAQISAASDGEVWGQNGTIVYRYTGGDWYQPNADARLSHVSVGSRALIWGTGPSGAIYSREISNPKTLLNFYATYR